MNFSTFAVATIALLGSANASLATVRVDSAGLGQGLLFPFYTTMNGQTTLINIQNFSPDAKALKLRVMEAFQGSEALTLNIYLAGHARWSAALALPQDERTAPSVLLGNGEGCTVPQMREAIALSAGRIDDPNLNFWGEFTRRGYVEVVEMGTLEPALAQMASSAAASDCDFFEARMNSGEWVQNPNSGLRPPSGSLRGDAVIMDTADGTSFGYQALAFNGLSNSARQFPLAGPSANPLSPRLDDIEADAAGDIHVEVAVPGEAPVTFRYPSDRGYDAISALLASSSALGNYNIDHGTDATSEWVLSLPTRSAYRAHGESEGAPGPFDGNASCASYAINVFGDGGKPDPEATNREFTTCHAVSIFKFFPHVDSESELAHPVFYYYGTGGTIFPIFADSGLNDLSESIGSASIDFRNRPANGETEMTVQRSAPDLDGKCWLGLPAWTLQIQAVSNANAQPGRIAAFPDARVASRTFDVVDCEGGGE